MSEGTGSTVECPVCGEQFNPTAAGGWCTNPDCGEWQHKGDDPAAQNGEPADDADTGPDPGEENIAETDPADTGSEDTETPGEGSERPEVNPPSESVDDSPVDDGSAVEEPLLDDEGGDAATHGGPAGAGSEEEVTRSGSGDLSGSESDDEGRPSEDIEDGEGVGESEDIEDGEGVGESEDIEDGEGVEGVGEAAEPRASADSASVEDSTESGTDPEEDDAWGAFEPADAGENEGSESNATEDTADESVETQAGGDPETGEESQVDAAEQVDDDAPGVEGQRGGVEGDPEPADRADSGVDEQESAEELACPECGTEVTADVQFCPECGTDVAHLPEMDEEEGTEQSVCPDCGAEVADDDSFCASCGADLGDAGTEPEPLTECPECGTDVDEEDVYCPSCGEHLDSHRAGGDAGGGDGAETETDGEPGGGDTEPAPEVLTLSARGREVRVADGDAVGRQVRRILMDTDGDEDEAVRVHREHVRFVREDDQFYVVDLGDNPTVVNGQHTEKGDRRPIGPGDELGLSGVVTLRVGRP